MNSADKSELPAQRRFWHIVKSRGAASEEMKEFLRKIQGSPEFKKLKECADEIIGTPLDLGNEETPKS